MEILDILRSRYTTKTYDSTFHLSDKQLEDINQPTITPKQRRSEVFL